MKIVKKFKRKTQLALNTGGRKLITSGAVLALFACSPQPIVDAQNDLSSSETPVPDYWPRIEVETPNHEAVERRVALILADMTLQQKVAQMIQPEIKDITIEDMRSYGFGSYLNGGGSFPNNDKHATPADWITFAESMYQASVDASLDGSTIPTMWGTDAVHGHNNVVGATLFPHNIGLGAANNEQLIEDIASATAQEVMVTGIDWVFAPTVAVVRDDRWGRTYEGYSEDPEIVGRYSAAIVKGLQGAKSKDFLGEQRVIATVKHFLGDGGTIGGDDQGNNIASDKELFEVHAQGYVGGLAAGAQTVMASFNSWHGKKNHGNKYLLTNVLKERMGFDGLVVGDWNGHGQIAGCTNDKCSQTINAGLDIFMVPTDSWKPLFENTIAQVESGEISLERIDDAVSRILRVKVRAGLFEKPSPANRKLSGKIELIGSKEHRKIARQAVRESLVLLKNKNNILPLSQNLNILVAGDAADNIGKQSGGWTITWQGTGNQNSDFPGATSILGGIKKTLESSEAIIQYDVQGNFDDKPDVAIVVFGEEPYAEGNGDLDNLEYQRGQKRDLELLQSLKSKGIPVVSVFISGRPMWVNAELNASDAFIAAWLPGTEGTGIAEVLFRQKTGSINYDFLGKLSFSWPATPTQTNVNHNDGKDKPLLPYGFGLSYGDKNMLADNLEINSNETGNDLMTLNLFNSPWRPAFRSRTGSQLITSSVVENDQNSYQTIDRDKQEDARAIEFKGITKAGFEINDNFPFDLRGYSEVNGSIQFDVRLDSPLEQSIFMLMRCETDCGAEIDISEALSLTAIGEWQTLSIELNCFEQLGATMNKIVAPFGLATKGKNKLSISNVKITPQPSENSKFGCF